MVLIEKWTFTWQVADDDKDNNSLDTATIRHKTKGRVIASFDSGRSSRWKDQTDYRFDVDGIMPLDFAKLDDYVLELTHDPDNNDNFKFYFKLEGFTADRAKKVYENRWGKIELTKSYTKEVHDL